MSLTHKPVLNLAVAKRIMAAAEAEAGRHGWQVAIAVMDAGGHLFCLQRSDDTQIASIDIAIAKARCALAFRRPTKVWSEAAAEGRWGMLGLPGVVPFEGGLPLTSEGAIVGAIGVSGVRAVEDGQIAQAGADAMA